MAAWKIAWKRLEASAVVVVWDMTRASDGGETDEVEGRTRIVITTRKRAHSLRPHDQVSFR